MAFVTVAVWGSTFVFTKMLLLVIYEHLKHPPLFFTSFMGSQLKNFHEKRKKNSFFFALYSFFRIFVGKFQFTTKFIKVI